LNAQLILSGCVFAQQAANRSLGGKDLKDIKSVFEAIDKDGSGDLDHEEFTTAMNRLGLGLTSAQVRAIRDFAIQQTNPSRERAEKTPVS